jgi:hypothetical protein
MPYTFEDEAPDLIDQLQGKSTTSSRFVFEDEPTDLSNEEIDTYGNIPSDLFSIASGGISVPSVLTDDKNQLHKIIVSFDSNTKGNSIQPMFNYSARLVLRGEINNEPFETKSFLTAKVVSKKITATNQSEYEEPLFLPNVIDCGFIEENDFNTTNVVYSNLSDVDEVKILSFEIQNESLYIESKDKSLIPLNLESKNIFKLSNFTPIEIKPSKFEDYYTIELKFEPKMETIPKLNTGDTGYYSAEMVVTYNHRNYVSTTYTPEYSTKIIRIPVAGISQKI